MYEQGIAGRFLKLETAAEVKGGTVSARYVLHLDGGQVCLNDHLGWGMTLTHLHDPQCSACQQRTPKLYNHAYCYQCFNRLARCDLCFVAPQRCHIHLGTCREPQWAQDVCMQPHTIYLANTSGAKVGITRAGREHQRWLNQGATEGLPLVQAPSRRAAGVVEHYLTRYLNDRTDWRRLVSGHTHPENLQDIATLLRKRIASLANIEQDFVPHEEMAELRWWRTFETIQVHYPVERFSPAQRLTFSGERDEICDNLTGVIGQYLLFSQGVLRLQDYQQAGIRIQLGPPIEDRTVQASSATADQLTLF